jgi:hypothetical protein
MFCPNCGTQASEPIKFCKRCGANLRRVQGVMGRGTGGFDWSKTWVAEMMLSEEERERLNGVTPEEKRYNEIKGGIITAFVGIGVMIFLRFLLGAIAEYENPRDAELLRTVWVAGLIPFLIGVAITLNGFFISKRIVELKKQQEARAPRQPAPLGATTAPQLEEAGEPLSGFSVTEPTTRRIKEPMPAPPGRETGG